MLVGGFSFRHAGDLLASQINFSGGCEMGDRAGSHLNAHWGNDAAIQRRPRTGMYRRDVLLSGGAWLGSRAAPGRRPAVVQGGAGRPLLKRAGVLRLHRPAGDFVKADALAESTTIPRWPPEMIC